MIKIRCDSRDMSAEDTYISMIKLKPLQAGYLQKDHKDSTLVMRTAIEFRYQAEVINLSNPCAGECWELEDCEKYTVRLLRPNETVTITLSA